MKNLKVFKLYFDNGDIDYIEGPDFWSAFKQAGYWNRASQVKTWIER